MLKDLVQELLKEGVEGDNNGNKNGINSANNSTKLLSGVKVVNTGVRPPKYPPNHKIN